MPVAWDVIHPALIAVFTRVSMPAGDEPPDGWTALWKERTQNFIHPEVRFDLLLKITSVQEDGEDDKTYEMLPTDPEDEESDEDLYEVFEGKRRFNLQVQVWCTDNEDANWALEVLERIRPRLREQRTTDELAAADVSLIEIGASFHQPRTLEKRTWSIGIMDVVFATTSRAVAEDPVGYIEHVNIESRLNASGDPDDPLPTPPNNAPGEWIPPLPED